MQNKDQHGEDTTTQTQAARREVELILIEMYDFRAHMEPSVQERLCAEVSDHYGQTVKYNQNWIAEHGTLVRSTIKRAKDKAIQSALSIRQYFLPKQAIRPVTVSAKDTGVRVECFLILRACLYKKTCIQVSTSIWELMGLHLRVQKLSTIVATRYFSHTYPKKLRIPDFNSGILKFNSGIFM
jgi:hypothetical protein